MFRRTLTILKNLFCGNGETLIEINIEENTWSKELDKAQKLIVNKILGIFDLYGIIIETRKGRFKHEVPLCELEVSDRSSNNYIKVEAYNLWFSNR